MIAAHQPTIFGSDIIAAVSSKSDGNLKIGIGDDSKVLENRREFLRKIGIDVRHTSLVAITYDTDDFTKYRIVTNADKTKGMLGGPDNHADALVTTNPGHALFLPIADCVGVVFYDAAKKVLMVSHIGRHSAEQYGAQKSVGYLQTHTNATPEDIKVWLSPAVGKASYPLKAFNGQSLHEVIEDQLIKAGIKKENIEKSPVDTANNEHYFSHSQYLQGNDEPGRFAVVAMMK